MSRICKPVECRECRLYSEPDGATGCQRITLSCSFSSFRVLVLFVFVIPGTRKGKYRIYDDDDDMIDPDLTKTVATRWPHLMHDASFSVGCRL